MKTSALSFGANPTKETIVELLSQEWPLSAKKIFRKLSKGHNLSITYQAIHKALKELTEKNILEKIKEGYKINKAWIKNLGDFSQKLEEELESSNQKREIKTIHKISFDIHRDFIKFHLDLMEDTIRKEGKINMIFQFRHVPYLHVLSNEDLQRIMPLMPKIKWSIISRNSTPLDIWNAKQWEKVGIKVAFDENISADRRIIINDYVIDAHMSKKAIKKWDSLYAVKDLHDFDVRTMNEDIFNQKFATIVILLKDKELASLLKA